MPAPTITIYSPRGAKIVSLPIYVGSKRRFELMKEDYVTLKFSLAAATFFPIGSYCDIPSEGRFIVTSLQSPSLDTATGGYSYELKMEADYRLWQNRVFKYYPEYAGREASFSLTDTPAHFLDLFLRCLKAEGFTTADGQQYGYEIGSDVQTALIKTLSFSNTNLIDALADIAEAWDTEWYVEGSTIHLGRCEEAETDSPVELKEGDNVESISRSDSQNDYATRLYIFGGESNIPARYRKSLIFDIKKLDLTASTATGHTIEDTARVLSGSMFSSAYRSTDLYSQTWEEETKTQTFGITGDSGTQYEKFDGTTEFLYDIGDTKASAFKVVIPSRAFAADMGGNFVTARTFSVTVKAQLTDGDGTVIESVELATASTDNLKNKIGTTTKPGTCTASVVIPAIEKSITFETTTGKHLQILILCEADVTSRNNSLSYNTVKATPVHTDEKTEITFTYATAAINITFTTGELAGQSYAATWNKNHLENGNEFTFEKDNADVLKLVAGNQFTLTPYLITGKVPVSYFTADMAEQMTINGVVQNRLMLPLTWNDGKNYIDAEDDLAAGEIVETVVCNDDIYPRFSSTDEETGETVNGRKVTAVGTREGTVTNEQTEEKESVTFYAIQDSGFSFSEDYVLSGETLQIQFQSGKLCGLTFEVGFHADASLTGFNGSGLSGQIFEIIRNEDYGRPLPDSTLYPQEGDRYVLIGWDSTFIDGTSLVSAAEEELLAWGKEYRDKLKVDPSTYSVSLMSDRAYGYNPQTAKLDPNYSLLATMLAGTRVRLYSDAFFKNGYRDSRIIGYERPLDIAYDTPTYIVGETAAYSRLGELTSKLDELTLQGISSKLQGTSSGGSALQVLKTTDTAATATDRNVFSALRTLQQFLRKDTSDNAAGLITFLAGLNVGTEGKTYIKKDGAARLLSLLLGDKGQYGIKSDGTATLGNTTMADTVLKRILSTGGTTGDLGSGFAAFLTDAGMGRMEVDELLVRNKAIFNELEVRKLSYAGGNIVLSPAGSVLEKVNYVDADGTEYKINDKGKYLDANGNEVTPAKYRCYFKTDDGTTATTNTWAEYDQARCQSFNIKEGVYTNVQNKYYWRLVTAVGDDYIDLSTTDYDKSSTDIPAAGDTLVQMGNRTDTSRQGFIYLQSEGDGAPCISEYAGVNSYTLTGKELTRITPTSRGNLFTGTFQSYSGGQIYRLPVYRGEYQDGTAYNYYDEVTYGGELWLCIVPDGETTTETPSDESTVWQRKTDNADGLEWTLVSENDGSETVATGETRKVIIKALKGLKDRTSEITTWKIERDTSDEAADAVWNAAHTDFQTQLDSDGHPYIELTLADLGTADVSAAKFTVTTESPNEDTNTYVVDADGNVLTTDVGELIIYNS